MSTRLQGILLRLAVSPRIPPIVTGWRLAHEKWLPRPVRSGNDGPHRYAVAGAARPGPSRGSASGPVWLALRPGAREDAGPAERQDAHGRPALRPLNGLPRI